MIQFNKISIQLENQGIEDHYLIPKWKETKRRNFILNMDIFFCLRSWDDTLDLDLRCLGCTAVIIPEMLLYADKAIELECRSQAVECIRVWTWYKSGKVFIGAETETMASWRYFMLIFTNCRVVITLYRLVIVA